MPTEKTSSTSAKILYRPVGLVSGIAAGAVAGAIVDQIWKRVSPENASGTPNALSTEYRMREILLASVISGAVYSVVRTLVNRGGAKAFARMTGDWPGN